jgi:hypothetical protein
VSLPGAKGNLDNADKLKCIINGRTIDMEYKLMLLRRIALITTPIRAIMLDARIKLPKIQFNRLNGVYMKPQKTSQIL